MSSGIRVIDAGPYELPELKELFSKLTLPRLASAWVACVVDSVSEFPVTPGNMARALIVVAQRLHGVEFDSVNYFERTPAMEESVNNEAGFEICRGLPPAPKSGQRNDPLRDAIKALQPGEHIRISEKRIKKPALASKINTVKKHTGRNDLRYYVAFNGDLVVTCDKVDEPIARGHRQATNPFAKAQARKRQAESQEEEEVVIEPRTA